MKERELKKEQRNGDKSESRESDEEEKEEDVERRKRTERGSGGRRRPRLKGIVSNYETDLCESQRVNQAEIPPKLSPSSGLGKTC